MIFQLVEKEEFTILRQFWGFYLRVFVHLCLFYFRRERTPGKRTSSIFFLYSGPLYIGRIRKDGFDGFSFFLAPNPPRGPHRLNVSNIPRLSRSVWNHLAPMCPYRSNCHRDQDHLDTYESL